MATPLHRGAGSEKAQDEMIAGLKDAYAMEQQAIQHLERLAGRLQHYPEFDAKINEHLMVSREQADRIEACLKRLGSDTSSIKSGVMSIAGNLQAMFSSFSEDEVVKAALVGYSNEAWEIASYTSLATTAEMAGDMATAQVCRQNLGEEETYARWLLENIPNITRQYATIGAGR